MKQYLPIITFFLTLSSTLAQTNSTTGTEALLGTFAIFVAGIWFFIMFMMLFMLASLIAFIWALIDILKARNKEEWKIMWVLVTFFFGIIGVVIYLLIGRKQRK